MVRGECVGIFLVGEQKMNILLLMMGGKGTRFGTDIPKQYLEIQGQPIFSYIVQKYYKDIDVGKMILVSHSEWIPFVKEKMKTINITCEYDVISGGETRSESVKNGLRCAMKKGKKEDVVLIHDATHPYVDVQGTKQLINIVESGVGATLGQFQYDTVYQMNEKREIQEVLQRQNIVSGASPEAFPLGLIYEIYNNATQEELTQMTSAGAIAAAHKIPMKVVRAEMLNLKITYQRDMELFYQLFPYYFADLIKIEKGKELLLG